MRVVISALLLCACISNPTPHPGVTGDTHGDDEATRTDGVDAVAGGDTTEADDTAEVDETAEVADTAEVVDTADTADTVDTAEADTTTTTLPFPPVDREVVVRSLRLVDLDQDGEQDLLLASAPPNRENDWGVYVFFDAETRADFSRCDAFLQTSPIPDAVQVGSLLGPSLDLIVFGQRGDRGLIEVHPLDGRIFGTPLTVESAFIPSGGVTPQSGEPVGLAVLNANGDAVPDLVVHDLDQLQVLTPTAWTQAATEVPDWTPILSTEPWAAILNIAFIEGASPQVGHLVVSQQWGNVHYFGVTGAGLDLDDTVVDSGVLQFGTALHDVDGDGRIDSVGFYDKLLSVRRFAPPAVTTFTLDPMPIAANRLDDLALGDVDGSSTLDLVALEDRVDNRTSVHVLRGLTLSEGELRSAPWRSTTLGLGQDPYRVAVIGRSGLPRVWLFDVDGASRCLTWHVGDAVLRPCP